MIIGSSKWFVATTVSDERIIKRVRNEGKEAPPFTNIALSEQY
jgi:hypothetical protein